MYTWVIFLALLWPFFWVVRVLFVTRLLLGFEFSRAKAKALTAADITPHLQEAVKPWVTQLESLGFRRLGGWQLNATPNAVFDDYAVVLEKATPPMRAIIQIYGESARSGECWLSLRTTKNDGTEIVTVSHATEELLPPTPGMDLEVHEGASPEKLLQAHLSRTPASGGEFWRCGDIQAAAVREQHIRDASLGYAHGEGVLVESGEGVYSYRPVAALKRSVAILRRAARQKKNPAASQRSVISALSPESQVEFDFQHYRQQGAVRQGRFSLKVKTMITCGSFVIFASVLAWQYSVVVAVTLIGALIVHECGHLLGMRWFGYRDTQLLFVPFFGGAAIGHDDKVLAPWKHIVIILLGPLPGIFFALMLFVYVSSGGAPAWIMSVAITTLILNAFNLLPILPLDGGQIVDYAVASRFPRLRVIFLALSAVGLVLFGLGLGGTKILFGVGIATLIRLPVEWRLAGLRRGIREEFPDGGEEEPIVRRLVAEMREPEWKKSPVSRRLQLVRGLQHALRMPRPGLGTMCLAFAGFTAPLWLGAPLAWWAVARQGDARIAQAHVRAEAAGLTSTPLNGKTIDVSPEENAAVPYEQARALASSEIERDESTAPAEKEKMVALLRTAAHRRVFVPLPTAAKPRSRATFFGWANVNLVGQLTIAATERLNRQEKTEAAALAIDALKLLRLMQAAPGALTWHEYKFAADSSWNVIEEVLAAGGKLLPDQLIELRHLCREEADVAFAAISIPRGLMALGKTSDETDPVFGATKTMRMVSALQRVNPFWTRLQVESIDQAIAVHELMQAITRGDWPAADATTSKNSRPGMRWVAELGNFIARQRQAKTALLLMEQRQHGAKIVSLETLGGAQAERLHPYTRAPMQLSRRGSIEVLSFTGTPEREFDADETPTSTDLIWRLPAEQR